MNVVPFTISNVYAGLGQCRGLLKDEGEHLTLELQLEDTIVGILKSPVQKIHIPIGDVVSLTLTKGWLGANWVGRKLVLQTSNVDLFSELPGASQGRVQLGIARRDINGAERFVADFLNMPEHAS
jgi:hypothetical protein